MALTAIPGGLWIPQHQEVGGPPAINFDNNLNISGTNPQRCSWIGYVPKTGTLDKAEFYTGFVSSPSAIKLSFQDVNTSGVPDGTIDQYRVVSSPAVGWTAPGLMTSDGTDTGSKRSVTKGDVLAFVIEWDSTQSGQVWPYGIGNGGNSEQGYLPYKATHNGTSYSKSSSGIYPSVVLKYNDGTYETFVGNNFPVSAHSAVAYNSGSSPDERGLRFSFPVSVKVDAAWVQMTSGGDCDVVLYDGTTALVTVSLDSDQSGSTAGHARFVTFAEQSLTANTVYRLALKPTTGTNVTLYHMTTNSADINASMPGGSSFQLTTRTDAGSWTDTSTGRPWIGIRVSAIESGGSGGAASVGYVG
jgi:hypothetical protein